MNRSVRAIVWYVLLIDVIGGLAVGSYIAVIAGIIGLCCMALAGGRR